MTHLFESTGTVRALVSSTSAACKSQWPEAAVQLQPTWGHLASNPAEFWAMESMFGARSAIILSCVITLSSGFTNVNSVVLGLSGYWLQRTNKTECAVNSALSDVNNDGSVLPSTTLYSRTLTSTGCLARGATDAAMSAFLTTTHGYTNGSAGSIVAVIGSYCSSSSMAMSPILAAGDEFIPHV